MDHPPQWLPLHGPANWYQGWYPPSWSFSEEGSLVVLHPPNSDDALTLSVLWLEDDSTDLRNQLVEAAKQFPKTRNVEEALEDVKLPSSKATLVGEASLDDPGSWWKRVFQPGNWHRWRLWGFQEGKLVVVAAWVRGINTDPEAESIARMILQRLELSDAPAALPDDFMREAVELARRKFPLLKCEPGTDFQITIGDSAINLVNFYRSYLHNPGRFEEILLPALTTLVQVQEWGTEQTEPPFEAVRHRIMPMLYPEELWKSTLSGFVGRPWIAGLSIMYVVDEARAYWYVRKELMDKWELTEEMLHHFAIENMHRYFDEHPMPLAVGSAEEGDNSMVMPQKPDSYNACRLLSDDFTSKLRHLLQGNVAVGVPGRDFFVAVSLKTPDLVENIRRRVAADFRNMDHPLTDRMLHLSADGVSEFAIVK